MRTNGQKSGEGAGLRLFPLFRELNEPVLRPVLKTLRWKTYSKGNVIFRPGDAAGELFLLGSGVVGLAHPMSTGGTQYHWPLEKTDIFGLEALIDQPHYQHWARSLTKIRVGRIPGRVLKELMDNNADLRGTVMKAFLQRNEPQCRSLEMMSMNDGKKKLCFFFKHWLAGNQNRTIPFTHRQLAEFTGMTRPTVSTLLIDLKESGVLSQSSNPIQVQSRQALDRVIEPGNRKGVF